MTPDDIPVEAIEAAAKAMWTNGPTTARPAWDDLSDRQREFAKHEARAALTAAFNALGMTVEKQTNYSMATGKRVDFYTGNGRLVSRWFPLDAKDKS